MPSVADPAQTPEKAIQIVDISNDVRTVMTMDAGGSNLVFSAIRGGRAIVEPICLPSHGDDLGLCLGTIVDGFVNVQQRLPEAAVAISFAFPGPADYPAGIIGDLPNLPSFKGGVPLGPMLEDRFEIPVLINNDGDLFTYGEAISGLLPRTEQALEEAGSSRRFRNLLGVTVGTGFGAGLVTGGELFLGDNGSGMEIWSTRSGVYEGCIAEEGVSARALRRVYADVAGIPFDEAPSPKQISGVLDGRSAGHVEAASRAFTALGEALGESLADAVCLTDGLVVIGGGVSLSHRHFLGAAVERMNGCLRMLSGDQVRRMEVKAFSLEVPGQRAVFLSQRPRQLPVPGTSRSVPYLADKSIGVGVSVLGSSEAVALGAYAWALRALDASIRSGRCRGRTRRGRCASHG